MLFQLRIRRQRAWLRPVASISLTLTLIVAIPHVVSGAAPAEALLEASKFMQDLPMVFVENRGQVDEAVSFYLRGRHTSIYFTTEGLTYSLSGPENLGDRGQAQRWVVRLDFVGASARPRGEAPTPGRLNYFRGKKLSWNTGVKTWERVVYENLWHGIDLVYEGTPDRLKYHLLVRPGADPSLIRFGYSGAQSVVVDGEGSLEVSTPLRSFTDHAPTSYQEVDGQMVNVETRWSRLSDLMPGRVDYGFAIADYDHDLPLIIDPATLLSCGFIGGSASESAIDVAVDGSGDIYISGYTVSDETSFPVTVGPDLSFNGGDWDAFVAKLRADGSGLEYCGFIGGSGYDAARGLAVDSAGHAYIAGVAASDEATFPVTVGPSLTHSGGGSDAFVAKVSTDGSSLIYCGYIGGIGDDTARAVDVDGAGRAYVVGAARSDQTSFPVTVGPDLSYNGTGDLDGFVARVVPEGSSLEYCGYIGGAAYEYAQAVAVNSSGNAFVVGWTESSETTFPTVVGPDLSYNGGTSDAFIAKVTSTGGGLEYSGYIGGSGWDEGYGVAVDGAGNAYAVGWTLGSGTSFPAVVGPDLTHNGNPDAFVARVNSNGGSLDYCGYIGGAADDFANGVAVDSSGNAYVVGTTNSTEATFPVVSGPDLSYNGSTENDVFVARVNANGSGLNYCGYIGGAEYDFASGVTVDSNGKAYVVGSTSSTEATFPVVAAPDMTYNGGERDAFVAEISSFDEIFADGFESGTTGAWSGAVP